MTAMLEERAWLDSQRRRLVRLCACITGDRAAAEDLAQETLLEAWRHRDRLCEPGGADRWLSAIARNVCHRWTRRRGRDDVLVDISHLELFGSSEDDLESIESIESIDSDERLESALALLPDATRDMVVRHYVDGTPHAEIAQRHSISEDAVSMRISRARAFLRTFLDPCADDGWRDTRVWCPACGACQLQFRRGPREILFRCVGCSPASASYDLRNPFFARLLGDLVRPTAILNRAAAWSSDYFQLGVGPGNCTRCRAAIDVRRHRDGRRHGLHGVCHACGEEVWSSVVGIAHSHPRARAFQVRHTRLRTLPERDLSYGDVPATVVRLESVRERAALEIVLARDTLRVLATH